MDVESMDYYLVKEFRERMIERYDPVSLVEICGITTEQLWEAFSDKFMDNEELVDELGINELEDE